MKILVPWDESLSVGVEKIDAHHQRLVELINQLHDAMLEKKTREVLVSILDELLDYTSFHFGFEEECFERFGFPDAARHREAHAAFVKKLGEFREGCSRGAFLVSIEMMKFLVDWLVTHIKGSDRQYVELFHANGLR